MSLHYVRCRRGTLGLAGLTCADVLDHRRRSRGPRQADAEDGAGALLNRTLRAETPAMALDGAA